MIMKIKRLPGNRPEEFLLRPCPFCANDTNLSVRYTANNGLNLYQIVCKSCWSETGYRHSVDEVIDLWNGE